MITILTGDSFQVEKTYQRMKSQWFTSSSEFNWDLFFGGELVASNLVEACFLAPIFSEKRMVVVRGADQIRKGELDLFEPHLATLPASTELVFLAEKLDRRSRFWQRAGEVGKWIHYRPREETDASFSSHPIFELTSAIGSRDLGRALSLYRGLQLSGESLVGMLVLIARHFRILYKVKETGEGAPPYFLKNYQKQTAGFSRDDLRNAVDHLFRADWELKSSKLSPALIMERLIWLLCRERLGKGLDK